ncbi:MAG: flagellar export chaperone FlgN [Deltaproteobacteria bacterium]|nr:flagellar export chaperone FlgN [Deltaproteobacteria bacterium]
MQKFHEAWHMLLDRHSHILSELEKGLHQERKALLASDIHLLREASLFKDQAVCRVLKIQEEINQFKQTTAQGLGVGPAASLCDLFEAFSLEHKNSLLEKRRGLLRQSRTIDKINRFNHKCLNTYMGYVDGIRAIYSLCKVGTCRTYTPHGQAYDNDNMGRLIDRSL